MIDPVKKDLHNVMAEQLTAADATFKDSINRLVNSQVSNASYQFSIQGDLTSLL
jgi:hypothetical protein